MISDIPWVRPTNISAPIISHVSPSLPNLLPFRIPFSILLQISALVFFLIFLFQQFLLLNIYVSNHRMTIKTWINSSTSSPSLFFGLFKLIMNESRLKNNTSFTSENTIHQPTHQKPFTPSVYTEKSMTIAPESTKDKPEFKSILKSTKKTVWALFLKYWFLLGLLVAIILAIEFPNVARKGGYIRAEWTIKWGTAVIIKRVPFNLFNLQVLSSSSF